MKHLLLTLLLAIASITTTQAAATITADEFQGFEAGNDGDTMTDALLASGKVGSGTWLTVEDPEAFDDGPTPNITIEADAAFPLYTPVVVGATTISTAGTRGMRVVTPPSGENSIAINFSSPTNPDSIAFNFRWNGSGVNSSPRDIVAMWSGNAANSGLGGGFQRIQLYDATGGANPTWRAHYQPNFTQTSAGTEFIRGRWYWVTAQHVDNSQLYRVSFYDTTTGYTLTGTESGTIGTDIDIGGMMHLQFGAIKYNADASQTYDFDNIVINTTAGTFPLGPGDGGVAASSPARVTFGKGQFTWGKGALRP